jgi:hypothetical protein
VDGDVGPDLQAQVEGEEALLAGLDHAGRGHHHGLARRLDLGGGAAEREGWESEARGRGEREERGRLDLGDGVAEPVHLHSGTNEGGQEAFTIKDEGGGGWMQMLDAKKAADTKQCERPVASRGV